MTGAVDYYPYAEGQDVKVSTGQLQASGEVLANPAGGPDDILVVAGQLIVTGPVTTVGVLQLLTTEAVPALQATWWSEFNSKISTAITRATATPVPALVALR